MNKVATLTAILSVLLFAGCASLKTYNPATGQSELIWISTEEEIKLGQGIDQQILQQYSLSTDPILNQKVNTIGQRLAQVSDRKDYLYQFSVIDDKELNAFTIPGGHVYVFRGLLERLQRDDQIAAVLAHEIGHCAAKHTVKKFQAAMGYNLIGNIILGAVGEEQSQLAALGSNTVMQIAFSAYGRKDEYQADSLGLKYLRLAGYDVHAMTEVFAILKNASEGPEPPAILSTHPHLDDRIVAAKEQISEVEAQEK